MIIQIEITGDIIDEFINIKLLLAEFKDSQYLYAEDKKEEFIKELGTKAFEEIERRM